MNAEVNTGRIEMEKNGCVLVALQRWRWWFLPQRLLEVCGSKKDLWNTGTPARCLSLFPVLRGNMDGMGTVRGHRWPIWYGWPRRGWGLHFVGTTVFYTRFPTVQNGSGRTVEATTVRNGSIRRIRRALARAQIQSHRAFPQRRMECFNRSLFPHHHSLIQVGFIWGFTSTLNLLEIILWPSNFGTTWQK